MNFEHNDASLRKVRLCLHRARQAIHFAGDPEAKKFEMADLRGAIRQITDNTASVYVVGKVGKCRNGKVGKYRNFRYWTKDALAAVGRGENVVGAFTGEHAIQVSMLSEKFVEVVGSGEVANFEDAARWLATMITIVTMTNEEKKWHGVDNGHTVTWDEFLVDPFARYLPELRRSIEDLRQRG